jgi:hypothetical protein
MAVGYQVHYILFKVGAGAANNGDFILTDHFCQANAKLCRTHGPGKGYHHFASFKQVGFVSFGRIHKRRSIKMAVVMCNKLTNGSFTHIDRLFLLPLQK